MQLQRYIEEIQDSRLWWHDSLEAKWFIDLIMRFSLKSKLKISQKTNGLVNSAEDRLEMIFITWFRVKYHCKIFMSCRCFYRSVVQIDNWVDINSFFLAEYYFLSLFGGIRVKFYFTLESQFTNPLSLD